MKQVKIHKIMKEKQRDQKSSKVLMDTVLSQRLCDELDSRDDSPSPMRKEGRRMGSCCSMSLKFQLCKMNKI